MTPKSSVIIRTAGPGEAPQIHALIAAHLAEGHLLPRALGELTVHAGRFIVAVRRRRTVGCGELAPLSHEVAEIRSLVVDGMARNLGVGRQIVAELRRRARLDGYDRLCAFTHDPVFFVRLGFSIVPHVWLPEKITTDCRTCSLFRACGQYAMVLSLQLQAEACDDALAALAVE